MSELFKNFVRPVLRVALRPLLTVVEKRKFKKTLVEELAKIDAGYHFSKCDIDLYVQERFTGLHPVTIAATDDADIVQATIAGKDIYWPAMLPYKDLPWLYHEIFDKFNSNPSSYDHPAINFKNKKWIMDAGAAEGYFSIFSLLKSTALLVVIEPLSLMRSALQSTLDLYAAGKETILVSAALSDKPGWSEIQVDYEHICDSTLSPVSGAAKLTSEKLVTERVAVSTIDELALQYGLCSDGMIKMDIEGYEMAALSGAVNLLKNYKPALAVAVYHDLENAKKCAEIIKAANPTYKIEFRGCYGYFDPPRPYMVFAY